MSIPLKPKLFERVPKLLTVRRDAVPAGVVFHKGDAFSFDGLRYYNGRFPFVSFSVQKCFFDFVRIMSVYRNHVPVERLPFIRERFGRHYILYPAVYLQVIVVHYAA